MDDFALDILEMADETGQISFRFAYRIAEWHSLVEEFLAEYAGWKPTERVDAGEYLHWLGY
jgi:hypothetical protein